MASINFTAPNSVDDILMFGRYYQTIVAMEPDLVDDRRLLREEEASFIRETAACDDLTAVATCQERLNLGLDYYYAVKHQITSFLRVWDGIIDQKRRYDAAGWFERSRGFIDSFQFCSYLIPQRVSIGFLGPYVGVPRFNKGFSDGNTLGRPFSYHSATPTVVNSPLRWTESIQHGNFREQALSDKEYPDALALSPTVCNDDFEDVDVYGGSGTISISSDDDSSDDDIDYSQYSDESDKSKALQFPSELTGRNLSSRGFEGPSTYQPKALEDTLREKLLNNLSKTKQPYETLQRDDDVGKRPPASGEGKRPSRTLEDVQKKRKFFAVQEGNEHEYEGITKGDKRPRAA
ncbi:uncharacterized protein F4807DRAFT_469160 [Annulohypoxylon truncatum]|uniref:uncharacterized protein n=1 Tax=Annulohypoxylon truncatum TaxID=327061 RepID=UPI0020077B82|nr:uncharacterized protein F4807DRAFT_469160 [Annulohypoxylon truncatum]KAI1207650.1 hypothetical protein F4807DRAFT_469160 [Annulohypoxylon truncatum]